ncbi:hypothetical protein O1611_g3383 [Lasiodiplodia mahajangana]|uniref:Uncharacterized protein n=1 Tax=Lasiodiplodia mahajangana TaxID=1108764 RepID=A0ACC2JRZ7_9PEZI|nr:hypothetical protein O1611_g3383 [Lasiodiplodia mahajangana]
MAPIPVYTNSPITAAKPDGVTPRTDAPTKTNKASTSISPTSTYAPSTHTTPTATTAATPQTGAVPSLPRPTGPAAAQPYSPLQPTPTTAIASASPAPPQPGSVPVSSLPPPPKAGERYQPPTAPPPTASMPIPYQMAIPAATAPYPSQQRGTSTATMASPSPYGAQIPPATAGIGGHGTQSLSHPPGYQQNANASEFDRYQRSAMEQRELDDGGSGIWDTAKKLAQQTGERLAAAENEVWKRINKE